jgi:hypothetical protein
MKSDFLLYFFNVNCDTALVVKKNIFTENIFALQNLDNKIKKLLSVEIC